MRLSQGSTGPSVKLSYLSTLFAMLPASLRSAPHVWHDSVFYIDYYTGVGIFRVRRVYLRQVDKIL